MKGKNPVLMGIGFWWIEGGSFNKNQGKNSYMKEQLQEYYFRFQNVFSLGISWMFFKECCKHSFIFTKQIYAHKGWVILRKSLAISVSNKETYTAICLSKCTLPLHPTLFMRIAVNTRFLLRDYLEGYGYFISETFRRITNNHPEHEFYFLFDRPFEEKFIYSSNITPIIVGPPTRHPYIWRYWYNYKIPYYLKKIRADVFVSPDGFCSLRTSIPQCLVIHDLSFLHYPQFILKDQLRFHKKFTGRFLQKAQSIATVSEFSKQDILKHFPVKPESIEVIYSAANEIFKPVSLQERGDTKVKFSGGAEYFLFTGAIHPRKNLINLLKAFSLFKKRQRSNMKLIIAGRLAWKNEEFLELLNTFKFRQDVVLPGYLSKEEIYKITASSYAMVYPSFYEGFGVPPLEAMKCNVPVIAAEAGALPEILGEAALFADPGSPESIAEKMMILYKDEKLRNELISKGKSKVALYSWDTTADKLWNCIEKILPK